MRRKSKDMIYTTTADEVIDTLLSMQDEERRLIYVRFFKTGKGEYGEGDKFLGITNPKVRSVVKQVGVMTLSEVQKLINSQWHEVRLCGLLILVASFEKLCRNSLLEDSEAIGKRDEIVEFYLKNAERANNWDLVDLSANKIIGRWLLLPTFLGGRKGVASLNTEHKIKVLDELAESTNLWRQRISMVSTWWPSNKGDASWCLRYAEKHLAHPHDLMHKAVGWMLREVGKHCSLDVLRDFLDAHYSEMPRTALRYAIERMGEDERQMWLKRK